MLERTLLRALEHRAMNPRVRRQAQKSEKDQSSGDRGRRTE